MKRCSILVAVVFGAGCAQFHPQPISSEQTAEGFLSRSLTNSELREFLTANLDTTNSASWDLKSLTLVAFYYQPALVEARMQLLAAQAARITAGQRPNPSVTVTPGYDSQIPGNPSPWIVPLTIDVPVETAGKRRRRIEESEHLAEAGRWNLVGTVWQVRSQVRAALIGYYYTQRTQTLLAREEVAQSNVVRLLEGQLAAGMISEFETSQARIALNTTQLAQQDAVGKFKQARVELAHALGLPTAALEDVPLSFPELDQFPLDLTRLNVRQQALLNRADVRGALAEYAASQSALQLQIAQQYPDVHLGPGYGWNTGNAGDNEWTLGLTVTLPLLNHNQGPVAEAEARRSQAAAHFLTVQANALAQIDGALAGYEAALSQAATAKFLLNNLESRLNSVRAQAQAGEAEPIALATAEVEFATGTLNQLDALVKAQQALGMLEDATQSPLTMAPSTIAAAGQNGSPPSK